MKVNNQGLVESRDEFLQKGYRLPQFDREQMIAKTKENPFWVHFGAGNIFRAFHANLMQRLLDDGIMDRGLVVVEGYDYEIIEKMYRPHDDLGIFVMLKSDGSMEKTIIGSVAESLVLDSENEAEFGRMKEIFASDSLQMATFTITEKGYSLVNGRGEQLPDVTSDLKEGPAKPKSYIGKVAALLYERFVSGQKPIAMVSTDNCSHNGDKLYDAMHAFAAAWEKAGLAEAGFEAYVNDKSKVSFPWSMIDKITPRPDASVEKMLAEDGIEELAPVITTKKTYVAPFVNAEETEYLVIEDAFPNGRPPLDRVGVIFTERETVDKVEKMKVCTCLNPLHTSLAIYGCLLGYTKLSDEMKDSELRDLIMGAGYREGLPVVIDPGILVPKEFIDTVVNIRIPNPFMPDTPQRIACDTSQKLPIRFGETIKAYIKADDKDVMDLKLIPLVYAGWLRYLMGVDDEGERFELSPDPLLDQVCPYVASFRLGEPVTKEEAEEKLRELLEDDRIFGVNLFEAGLADRVLGYFLELIAGKGAVRATLKKYVH